MLPQLPVTDICLHRPDVDGLDLWASDFTWEDIPREPGVYCFYDVATEEKLYIGSGVARGVKERGLSNRMRQYRNTEKNLRSSEKRIRGERQRRKILVRCWVTSSVGDALKYEQDAIEKYKPVLNERTVKRIKSIEDKTSARHEREQKYRLRPQEVLLPGTTAKRCFSCNEIKPLSEFAKLATAKNGRQVYCKVCQRGKTKEYGQKLQLRSPDALPPETTLTRCCRCREIKPLSEFYKSSYAKNGHLSGCKECRSKQEKEYRRINRESIRNISSENAKLASASCLSLVTVGRG